MRSWREKEGMGLCLYEAIRVGCLGFCGSHSFLANLKPRSGIESTGREKWDQSSSRYLSYPGHSEKGTSMGGDSLLPHLVVWPAAGNVLLQDGCLLKRMPTHSKA